MSKTKSLEQNGQGSEPYITNDEAAAILRLSPRTLENMRIDGRGPRFYKAGRGLRARVLYRRSDIERWLSEQCYSCTAEYNQSPV